MSTHNTLIKLFAGLLGMVGLILPNASSKTSITTIALTGQPAAGTLRAPPISSTGTTRTLMLRAK
jgi:hypothetical protein